ncbi:ragulator complex protein LAMTOR3-A-like [Halichondria panicea]|uniref:ragulator complex protein LAMTOR3-A-like n=1 Tax=Halichondria panicea TaxID=6063 RepID=UPI00312B2F7F
MTDELQTFVRRLLPTVDGLEAIVVSDRDGVILIEARSGNVPSAALKPPFLGVFSIASEQASKLEVGKNKSIISYYSGHQVVQFNYFPLVVTFIAAVDANTGLIYALEEEMKETVTDLKSAVAAN